MFEWSKFQPSFQEIRPSAKGFLRKDIDAQVAKCFGAGVEPWLAFKLVGYDYGRHLWIEIPSFIGFCEASPSLEFQTWIPTRQLVTLGP